MKRLFIAIFMLVAVVAQAQIITFEDYECGRLGFNTKLTARKSTLNEQVNKILRFEMKTTTGTMIIALSEQQLESVLMQLEDLRNQSVNLSCDYFEKYITIITDARDTFRVGYYVKTKLDATKAKQWFVSADNGIKEFYEVVAFDEIYRTLGHARNKLKSIQ